MPTTAVEGVAMSNQILYFEYEEFQLEGIPPYPSPYVAIDAIDRYWVDVNDPNRFRSERYFRTREATPVEGIESFRVGTGTNGVIQECQLYDGKTECTQQPITSTLTYDAWLENFGRVVRRFLENINAPNAIGGYIYRGTQTDEQWGEVHVFEREGTVSASDLYKGYPMTETLKLDTEPYRQIEWTRIVADGDKSIIHASIRLTAWKIIGLSEIPPDLFSIQSK
jgi:hypothetical protein